MALKYHPISPERFDETQNLSARQFGRNSYQATRSYLEWLYVDHPRPEGQGLLGYNENGELTVVCHEFLGWTANSGDCVVAHNLFTYPKTSTGIGGAIVIRYSRMPMVVPGAVPPLTDAYEAAGFTEVPIKCFIRKLKSPHFLFKRIEAMMSGHKGLSYRRSRLDQLAQKYDVHIDTSWDQSRFYVARLFESDALEPDFLAWRHFSPKGPKTLVFHDGASKFAFVTIGLRKNLIIARIGDNVCDSDFLTGKLFPVLNRLGVVVILANSRKTEEWPIFGAAGMESYNQSLRAFVTRRIERPQAVLSASFSDLGFEAIKTIIADGENSSLRGKAGQ